MELENANLVEKLSRSSNEQSENSAFAQEKHDLNEKTSAFNEQYVNNMKLLEEKFNKIMKENAELIDKNQNLEHIIQQLQFETETISKLLLDYFNFGSIVS